MPYDAPAGFPSVLTDTAPANHSYNFFAQQTSSSRLLVNHLAARMDRLIPNC
jgi:hypothetical protein